MVNYTMYVTMLVSGKTTIVAISGERAEVKEQCLKLVDNVPSAQFLDLDSLAEKIIAAIPAKTINLIPDKPNPQKYGPCNLCGAEGVDASIAKSKYGGYYCKRKKGDKYCRWTSDELPSGYTVG